ncbi:MAG TPA: A24 family peptidase [Vicinamibacterales bacterium]|nr:A24 family peptidase [Vicinamibacterales bacterium]
MPPPTTDAVVAAVAVSGVLAAAIDVRTRRIPNLATLGVAGVGLGLSATGASGHTAVAALAGLVLGLLLMLPGHLFGATGAGDVKLFAAMGTLLGPGAVLSAFLYTAIAGGILAFAIAVRRRRLIETVGSVATLVASRGAHSVAIEAPHRHNRFAYAPAIAVGTLLAALGV